MSSATAGLTFARTIARGAIAWALLAGCQSSAPAEPRHPHLPTGHLHTSRSGTRLLPLPKQDDCFFFTIFGDRTGGRPEGLKILQQAVSDTNLLDPDLVMTVGDLIQGYNRPEEWQVQAKEYSAIMDQLAMPWFPVAGNHDVYQRLKKGDALTNKNAELYEQHFGPLWYWFAHKKSAFVVLYSDEGNPKNRRVSFRNPKLQRMSPEQFAWLDQTLKQTANAEHVFVFLHHPRWRKGGYGDDWERVHQRLAAAGNVRAVFAGHIHHMVYGGKRDGIEYFTLAGTGSSVYPKMPAAAGYLHHFNLVTVRKDGIKVTTIPVGTVMDPKLLDEATVRDVRKLASDRHEVTVPPLPRPKSGATDTDYAITIDNPCEHPIEITLIPRGISSWTFAPDHEHATIAPGGKQTIRFRCAHPATSGKRSQPKLELQVDWLGQALRITMPTRVLDVPASSVEKPQKK